MNKAQGNNIGFIFFEAEKQKNIKKQGLIQNEIQVLCPSDPKQLFLQPFSKRVIISNLNVILIKTDDEKTFFHQPVDFSRYAFTAGQLQRGRTSGFRRRKRGKQRIARPAGRNGL